MLSIIMETLRTWKIKSRLERAAASCGTNPSAGRVESPHTARI